LARAYKVVVENTPPVVAAAPPIYEYVLNSAICQILPGKATGEFSIRGYALPVGRPGNRIKSISIKCDQWQDWKEVEIVSPIRDFCWVLWSGKFQLPPNAKSIQVRATDTSGNSQPVRTPWNAHGYQYNGWHAVNLPKI
ncbi:MAG: Sulfite oxidase, partial [Planctomycetaceae bacterium]|nr:Sulfite oxidase [Planctomycetaceae bacterium]